MAKLEEESKALEGELEAAACDYERYSALNERKQEREGKLLELMERWEQLAQEAEL